MKKLKLMWQLFLIFFKIGTFTFGGGLAMLPLIQKEVVDKRKWVKEEEILDIFAVAQSVPGVIAINSATFIGNKLAGIPGAIFAAFGVILPAFASILIVISILIGLKDNVYVGKVFSGIRAASAALILLSAIKLGKSAIKGKIGWVVAIVSFTAIVLLDIHAAWAVVFGGVSGFATHLYDRRKNNV
jgi:chromate transporter